MFSEKYIDQFTAFLGSRKRVPAPDVKQHIEQLQFQLETAKQALRPFAELAKALDEVHSEHYRGKWMTVDSEASIRVYGGTLDIDLSKRLPDEFDLIIVIEEFAGGNNHTIISVENVRAARKLLDEMERTR